MDIKAFSFQPGYLDGKLMFKLTETARAEAFVSEQFRAVVEQNGLRGLIFRPVMQAVPPPAAG